MLLSQTNEQAFEYLVEIVFPCNAVTEHIINNSFYDIIKVK